MMKYTFTSLILAVNLAICIATMPTSAASFVEQLYQILGPQKGPDLAPLDALFVSLAIYYGSCSTKFQLAEALRNNPGAKKAASDARQCQLDNLAAGNASLFEMKDALSKPGAQEALKNVALYWRGKMSDVGVSHSEAESLEVLRTLKSNIERVRLEMDW